MKKEIEVTVNSTKIYSGSSKRNAIKKIIEHAENSTEISGYILKRGKSYASRESGYRAIAYMLELDMTEE